MPCASLGRLKDICRPIWPRNHQGLWRLPRHLRPDKSASDLWRQPCDPCSRRSSGTGAQGARYRSEPSYREGCVDGVREALEAINNGNQDIFQPPVLQIVHDRQPDFCALGVGNPYPQNLTFTLRSDAQSHVNSLVLNLAAFRIADFDPQGIQENPFVVCLQTTAGRWMG